MKGQVSVPIRRTFAVVMLFSLVSTLFSCIVQPILDDYGEAKSTVDRLEAAIQRSQGGQRDSAQLRAELAALQKRQSSTGGFLQVANESVGAARLQERLKASVEAAKGDLRSTQSLPSRDEGKFRRITVRAQVSLDTPGVQRTLYDLESSSPFLFVDNVVIRNRSKPQDRGKVVQDPVLDVSFDLSGYMRRPM